MTMQMNTYKTIEQKIDKYIRKFYINELLKGAILFFSATLLYFIITTTLEYFLWLSTTLRALLFWSLVLVSLLLFARFILWPLAKLFRLAKGIDYNDASNQIGKHFPEVNDKLTNLLQLKSLGQQEELVLAGIEQKSKELTPIPFQLAIDLKSNLKYLKFAVVPLLIIIGVAVFGKFSFFKASYNRVVNYQTYYEPPAPFIFNISTENLEVNENENLTLFVSTIGDVIPDQAKIHLNEQSYFLKPLSTGYFTYTIEQVKADFSFYFTSNGIRSKDFNVKVVKTPRILDLELVLDYPKYTFIKDKSINGQGSISVPEGTEITWNIKTQHTDTVSFLINDKRDFFIIENENFTLSKSITTGFSYSISTSNEKLKDFENLSYNIKVTKDQYPKIKLQQQQDSTTTLISYFKGNVSDDYGLRSCRLVYYPQNNLKDKKTIAIPVSTQNFDQFLYTFPNETLELKEGESYEFYFEVFDNDAVNGSKSTQSQVFGYRLKTQSELEDKFLQQQNSSIDSLKTNLDNLKDQKKELEELEKIQKEKQKLNYSDKQKLSQFVERQKQQREMMKDYMKSLKNSLQEFKPQDNNREKEALQERIKNNEKLLQQNEELLKELESYQDKIENEELKEKLDKFSKSSKQQERSLEQLLELTKRYYVEQKAQKLAEAINKLAEAQEKLSEVTDEKEAQLQKDLKEDFKKLQEELDNLEEENAKLKEPMQIERDKISEKLAEQEQQKAQEKLDKSESNSGDEQQQQQSKQSANQNQKNAAEKMKQMAKSMGQSIMSMSSEQNMEDAETLKQILDNLITFSKEQEELMFDFKEIESTNPAYAKKLRRQGQLRENFEHIDDSLFALALRNPLISDQITYKLTDIQYDIEKSLERLAETQIRLGTTSQQYVMVNSNELANMLDNSLDNMQANMSGSGEGSSGQGKQGQSQGGQGQGFQLSDIIKSHEELSKKMGQQQGNNPGQQGQGQQQGQSGENGSQGEGQSGNQQGKNGESKSSQDGKDGKGGGSGEDNQGGNGTDGAKEGMQQGLNEEMSAELFEIYKQQQELRDQLEDRIEQLGLKNDAQNLEKSLDNLEQDMLMQGFSADVLKQMENIKHQLLKLDKAAQQQGQENQRQATTNYKSYQNTAKNPFDTNEKEIIERFEILNRQQLPLQTNYKELIKKYFNETSD